MRPIAHPPKNHTAVDMPRSVLIILMLLFTGALVVPSQVHAQLNPPLETGDDVRITYDAVDEETRPQRLNGEFLTLTDSSVTLLTPEERSIPLSEVQTLEVVVGHHRGRGILRGAGAGLIVGLVAGAAVSMLDVGGPGANMAIIGVPLWTVPIGALMGFTAAPPRWRRYNLDHTAGAGAGGIQSGGIELTFRF